MVDLAQVLELELPTDHEWTVQRSEHGWYVVGPFGRPRFGPYSEALAERQLPMLRTRFGDPWC